MQRSSGESSLVSWWTGEGAVWRGQRAPGVCVRRGGPGKEGVVQRVQAPVRTLILSEGGAMARF